MASALTIRSFPGGGLFVLPVVALFVAPVSADVGYPRYRDGCQNCHGEFEDGTSPRGTIFPHNDKHKMHRDRRYMATDCNLCHSDADRDGDDDDDRNPFLGFSNGTDNVPGVGCTGCHGRDYGGTIGSSGVGLRRHHFQAGITLCAGCHFNDPEPLPESVPPVYYGSPDTRVEDPCNHGPEYPENWSVGDTLGLDNDGDGIYDEADSDCRPPCPADLNGDRIVDMADLDILLSNFGRPSGAQPEDGDLNGDGAIGLGDLSRLLQAFGQDCP